ncbi:MAG: hypothetical protein Q9157_007656 [Trypethelium eluteriae]
MEKSSINLEEEVKPSEAPEDAEKNTKQISQPILIPQPSNDPADPLNWPLALKIAILVQICLLGALGGLNTAIINPAYGPMAKELGISTVTASYQTYGDPESIQFQDI